MRIWSVYFSDLFTFFLSDSLHMNCFYSVVFQKLLSSDAVSVVMSPIACRFIAYIVILITTFHVMNTCLSLFSQSTLMVYMVDGRNVAS